MDIESSPRPVVAIPKKLANVSVGYVSVCGYESREGRETSHHFPLGGTTIGTAVMFVVLDMAFPRKASSYL